MSWLIHANAEYSSGKEVVKNYQNIVTSNKVLADKEQEWVDTNLSPLIDFMGDEDVWLSVIPGVQVLGAQGRASSRKLPITSYPVAVFSGAHWTTRKPNEATFFDPYKEYQIPGTNQFCQTFAMMYLADALPPPEQKNNWKKNYKYSKDALEFIKTVISGFDKNDVVFNKLTEEGHAVPNKSQLLQCVRECLKYPNICVNAIEYPTF